MEVRGDEEIDCSLLVGLSYDSDGRGRGAYVVVPKSALESEGRKRISNSLMRLKKRLILVLMVLRDMEVSSYVYTMNKIILCDCAKILIVDDNAFNLYSLGLLLESLGHKSVQAINGKFAIEAI